MRIADILSGYWRRYPKIAKGLVFIIVLAVLALVFRRIDEGLIFLGVVFFSLSLFKKRKWISAGLLFLLTSLWLGVHRPIKGILKELGADSFDESRVFEWDEAFFWFSTLKEAVSAVFNVRLFFFCVIIFSFIFLIFGVSRLSEKMWPRFMRLIGIFLICSGFLWTFGKSVSLFLENTDTYAQIRNNFSALDMPRVEYRNEPLSVLVYIGESTSAMNMGIYGYPRDTTPALEKIKKEDFNLLIFSNVFSTHTHTSPSLLEALSFGSREEENFLPINQRKRLSVVDLLEKGGIKTTLYSNQGESGTWNQASSIVFKNARRYFSTESRLVGNSDYKIKKPWDNDLFAKNTVKDTTFSDKSKSLVVFHTYAGHGPYLNNIPEDFKQKVDTKISDEAQEAIIGKNQSGSEMVDQYDSAVKYVDFSVSEAIKFVQAQDKPIIFLYFADHGDAVYTGRGHDSSRFSHEMARVPLVLYFNDAAKKAYPQLFEKYKKLSLAKNISTLAQIPYTILDLLGVRFYSQKDPILDYPVVGVKTALPPIIVRRISEGLSFINLNNKPLTVPSQNTIDVTDDITRIFVDTAYNPYPDTYVCYHRSNTLGKALRGALVANCLEIDLVVRDNGSVAVYHPPAIDSGFDLEDALSVVRRRSHALWLDSKNLQSKATCSGLLEALKKFHANDRSILIEFPSKSHVNKEEISDCAAEMKKQGYATAYYSPTSDLRACSKALEKGRAFYEEKACVALRKDVEQAWSSGLFTDLTFDYSGVEVIEKIAVAKEFKWNTWNVMPGEFNKIRPERFRMVILKNKDPNNL